ncbi:MAG: cell envelope integrity protein CreD [Taibaiella sp.]|nr:cell envelope integrity protein CreD [Taibaiella sp.]
MNQHDQSTNFWDKNKALIKGVFIGFLTLVMLIPQVFISGLVSERRERREEVIKEISGKWASAQTIKGPLLMVPYIEKVTTNGKAAIIRKTIYLPAEELKIDADIQPEKRHRSLFDVTLYNASINMQGKFASVPLALMQVPYGHVLWNEVKLIMGIDDLKGLGDEIKTVWNGTKRSVSQAFADSGFKNAITIPITIDSAHDGVFSIALHLKGSGLLYFTPSGKTTEVTLHAPWKDPAFGGAYLPSNTPLVNDKGFTAHWKILPFAHTCAAYWENTTAPFYHTDFGVTLLQPADGYAKTERAVKYALLFISLTFVVFFFLEILQKKEIHPLQYIPVGFALCIFYTLLLSISEYLGFNIAYVIAAVAIVSLIGLYVMRLFTSTKTGISFASALAALYTYIFILIQLQDYALLFGSIGLFVIIAILMYYSGKINWYHTKINSHEKSID